MPLRHALDVVGRARGVAADTEGQPVVRRVDGGQNMLHVALAADNARQPRSSLLRIVRSNDGVRFGFLLPEQRHGRVVRVDGHVHAGGRRGRHDLAQKVGEVCLHRNLVDARVRVQASLEVSEARPRRRRPPWKACGHSTRQRLSAVFGHVGEARGRARAHRRVIACLGAGTLQQVQLEGRKVEEVEGERAAPVRPPALEVGAGPVDDGHEVVAEEADAAPAEVGDRGLVLVDEGGPLWLAALLDRLVHGDALRHGPRQPAAFDERFACLDRIDRPHVANRDVVQRGDDAGGAGLLDVLQRDGVVRAVPAPRLLHSVPARTGLAR
mmetsp:Transcript_46660/g.151468  ORF Transcript_46660/g.151468 Transcript_46660/m.151468 type:complete len:325 (-) Transcript_46660:23-997(-)